MGNCCQTNGVISNPLDFMRISISPDQQIEKFLFEHPLINEVVNAKNPYFQELKEKEIIKSSEGIYVGSISQSKSNGKGIMMYKQGFFYEGQWRNGLRNGAGRMIYENGDYYQGEWTNNEPFGQGSYQSKQHNIKYVGRWVDGSQHGLGKEIYQDGSYYEGQFVRGQKSGKGKIVIPDGSVYQGQFKNNQIVGQGVGMSKQFRYQGKWHSGIMDGHGKSEWLDPQGKTVDSYIGQYSKGQKHGFGQYHWGKGKVYKGTWENGEIRNNGVLINQERK